MPETKKQKRMIVTIWEGGITELRVPKIVLSRRQVFWIVLVIAATLTGIEKLPEIIEWGKNLLSLLG